MMWTNSGYILFNYYDPRHFACGFTAVTKIFAVGRGLRLAAGVKDKGPGKIGAFPRSERFFLDFHSKIKDRKISSAGKMPCDIKDFLRDVRRAII